MEESTSSLNQNEMESSSSRKLNVIVKLIEQPASKSLRFRYECEGRSAGSIPGVSSTNDNKTYPTLQILGFDGRAVVVVSCVTKDEPYRPHPHNLVGREGCKKGVCTLEIPQDTMTVSFSNLGIQCVKKKDIESSLKVREEIRVDPFRTGFNHKTQPIDLNSLRLCFQVFLEGETKGTFTIPLKPIISDPIYDKKSTSDLIITKLSDCNSYVDGGRKDLILLCEKVTKDDIQIRFYEEKNGELIWEAYGDFQPNQVHKQTAIWFKTPRYRTLEITEPVKAFIQLKRPSDGNTSESLPFEFLPLDSGRPSYWSLHKNLMKNKTNLNIYNIINNNYKEDNKIEEVEVIPSSVTQEIQEIEPNNNIEMININKDDTEDKTFNQLIDEVAELDEIYSQNKKIEHTDEIIFDDNKTYSSLQLAYHNPLIEENLNKRESIIQIDDKPPLPPKRQKKIETFIGNNDDYEENKKLKEVLLYPKPKINRSHSFNNNNEDVGKLDNKYLGSTSTLPNPKKQGFFSKLFGRKKNKSTQDIIKKDYQSLTSLQDIKIRNSIDDTTKPKNNLNDLNVSIVPTTMDIECEDLNMNLDLTEAEHYALYTMMAPHATQSEFDEMSCYYAPVEGGKILNS